MTDSFHFYHKDKAIMDEKCNFFFIFMKKVQTCPTIWDNLRVILHPETRILTIKTSIDMKTYIEISQPTTTSSILAIRMEKLQSLLQSLTSKFKGLSLRNRLILVALVMAMVALFFGCNLFSLILIALFLIALGVVINEFVEYIRFIRELD